VKNARTVIRGARSRRNRSLMQVKRGRETPRGKRSLAKKTLTDKPAWKYAGKCQVAHGRRNSSSQKLEERETQKNWGVTEQGAIWGESTQTERKQLIYHQGCLRDRRGNFATSMEKLVRTNSELEGNQY